MRKRLYKKLEPYPHPDAFKRLVDKVMYAAALLGPLALLPQVVQIFETRDVTGLALLSWFLFLFFNGLWLLYGLLHKEMPIVMTNVISGVLNFTVIVAILAYG